MLTEHLVHMLVILTNGTDFASQNAGTLFRTHVFKLNILQEVSQSVFNASFLFSSETVLHFDTVLSQIDNFLLFFQVHNLGSGRCSIRYCDLIEICRQATKGKFATILKSVCLFLLG